MTLWWAEEAKIARDGLRIGLGLGLAVGLLWWVFRGQNLAELGQQMRQASPGLLFLGGLVNLAHIPFRVFRWRHLLDDGGPRIPFRPLFAAVSVGYMTSWVLPGGSRSSSWG